MQLLALFALGFLQFGWVLWPQLGFYVGAAQAVIFLGIVVAGCLSRFWRV
jgi:hypothetical protein